MYRLTIPILPVSTCGCVRVWTANNETNAVIADFCSESMLKGWAEDKNNTETADEMFDKYIKYYNACFERPSDMHLGIHLCRGNYIGRSRSLFHTAVL